MRPDITVGSLFPDYELSDHTGTVRSISEIQRNLPTVLHLAQWWLRPKGAQVPAPPRRPLSRLQGRVHAHLRDHEGQPARHQRVPRLARGYWYWGRPTIGELHQDLRALLKKTRVDFDPHAPGLLEAWERGERDQFLVESIEPAIRNTEGTSVGIKR